jgi:hypothetical protein
MKKLTDLTVDKISLVTKDKKPAVEKASTGFFSVFKIKKEENLTEEQLARVEKLKTFYEQN